MRTIVEKVDNSHPEERVIIKAAEIIRGGGLVAFPTETVYGLGANGLDAKACRLIYQAKGRPSDNPLILHISDLDGLNQIVKEVPEKAKALILAFWPGPLTLIFPKSELVPKEITGGLETVAVRFPSSEVARQIIRKSRLPIAAPSANSSGKPSPTRASHVEYDLLGMIDMIIDGGPCEVGLESTIVDVTGEIPVLLRPGAITKEMLEEIIGCIEVDPAVYHKPDPNLSPKAPGMKYIHYSPKADITLVKGELLAVAEKINNLVSEDMKQGKKVGIIASDQTKYFYNAGTLLLIGDRMHPEIIGQNLFKILRKTDYLELDKVYSEVFDETAQGAAIMNRLYKAAGYRIITV